MSATLAPSNTAGTRSERDPAPFQRFLDAHRDCVWRFLVGTVGREDAEDCFQETFIAALRTYPDLQAQKREHNLRAWVLTIAHRKALDAHRGRARRARSGGGCERAGVRAQPRPGAVATRRCGMRSSELPERQRSAVVLRYVIDLPHREIAAAIGCSEEAARRSLHEGMVKLRKAVPA